MTSASDAPKPADPRSISSAVALHYARGSDDAPTVTAKGRGATAEAILAAAREHGVPVREDPDLVELLSRCELGDSIPTELYSAVARILGYLYALNTALAPQAEPAGGSTASPE
jgi:flagellar biosynthesis protein